MAEPVTFQGVSPRHHLPLLFAAQAQKEVVVNQAMTLVDSLLHPVILDELADPPVAPEEGQCWLIAADPTGVWSSHASDLAIFSGGDWLFITPSDGLRCWHAAERRFVHFDSGWSELTVPSAPVGGAVVDSESRQAISELIGALREAGVFTPE